jgi:putative colanic acid biosynthesis acetyltransferase WcaF
VSAPPRLQTKAQPDAYTSPWSTRERLAIGLWSVVWGVLFRPTPKPFPFTAWRLFLLRLFGAKVEGSPFVSAAAKIKRPWDLVILDRACISPGAEVYNLGHCIIRARANVTQYVYLCGGTHDLSVPHLPLVVGTIDIGEDAFLGARSMILPGITIGPGAVVGAGSVVTKDVAPWTIVAGNPARFIKARPPFGCPISPDGLSDSASSPPRTSEPRSGGTAIAGGVSPR